MSQHSPFPPSNPYQAPNFQAQQPLPQAKVQLQQSIQYLRAYTHIFENPNWFANTCLVALCGFIPVIGGLVVLGYFFMAEEARHRRLPSTYSDFTFAKFSDYLVRGLWPFLVALVASLALWLVLGVLFVACMAVAGGVGAAGQGQGGEEAGGILLIVMLPLVFLFSLAAGFLLFPMVLRAGYSQQFASAFNVRFALDFVSRMWVEMLLGWLFLMATAWLVMLLGMLALCVGVIPAAAIVQMAQSHLYNFQMYEVYLSRGGEPIPLSNRPL